MKMSLLCLLYVMADFQRNKTPENSFKYKTTLLIIEKARKMKKTIVLTVDPEEPDPGKIVIAARIIKGGGLVAFPTETVYGLGANAFNPEAILKLFEAKKRPLDNPPIIHVENVKDVYKLVENVPLNAEKLMRILWPGPLTLIFKRSQGVPEVTVACLDTIAVRMPMHNVALALIRESNCPIAAPSGNLAGKPSPTSAKHVFDDLNGRIDVILDGGPTRIGVESTVLDLSLDPPMILRPGGIPYETLNKILGNVQLHPFVVADKELSPDKVRSPGMKHRHYAPNAKVIVVEGKLSAVVAKIMKLADLYKHKGINVGVLATDETQTFYSVDIIKSLGSRFNLDMVARSLYGSLRDLDDLGVDVILAEGLSAEGLGLAVMNRLRKAAGYNIIKAE
jgi:L-threonylcarbamoyladenylate synthase